MASFRAVFGEGPLAKGGDAADYIAWRREHRRGVLVHPFDPGERCRWFRCNLSRDVERTARRVEAFHGGRMRLLGSQGISLEEGMEPWHRELYTGSRWPLTTMRETRIKSIPGGDVKTTWELSRCAHLVALARHSWHVGDPGLAQEAVGRIVGWLDANPAGKGVNWFSNLEVGLRAIAWVLVLELAQPWNELDPVSCLDVVRGLVQHAMFLARDIEVTAHTIRGNHLLGEAAALVIVAAAFPEWSVSDEWGRIGRKHLIRAVEEQFRPDGMQIEESAAYHRFCTELLVAALIASERSGRSLGAEVDDVAQRAIDALVALRRADGRLTNLGDDDDAVAIPMDEAPAGDPRPLIDLAAVRWRRDDWAATVDGPREMARWLMGDMAHDRLHRVTRGSVDLRKQDHLADTGVVILRSEQLSVRMRAGDLKFGHGHADLLALEVADEEGPIVVDPGTYCYTRNRKWRDHFRCTASHSTLVFDGQSQRIPLRSFAWAGRARGRHEAPQRIDGGWRMRAWHEVRAPGCVRTRTERIVLLLGPSLVVVRDHVTGVGRPNVTQAWQLAPGQVVQRDGGVWRWTDGRRALDLWCSVGGEPQVAVGDEHTPAGWIAPSFGEREPAPNLSWSERRLLPVTIFAALRFRRGDTTSLSHLIICYETRLQRLQIAEGRVKTVVDLQTMTLLR